MDEPTSGLDGANLHRIAGALRQLSDEGKAVLVITHDLELVDMVCDSAIRLPLQKQIFQQLFNKLIGKPMTTIVEQQNKINELLNSGRPVTLETIAQALAVTAQEAAHLLPEGSATFAPGSDFESVWAAIAEWEKITFIVTAHGNVIEVETKLVTGKAAMGYYNLMGGKSPLQRSL